MERFRVNLMDAAKTCPQMDPSRLPEHSLLNMIYFWTCMKWAQPFPVGGHAHGRHPCQVWMNFPQYMHVVSRPAIYKPVFTEKTLKNARIIKNLNSLTWCLDLIIEGGGKISPFEGCWETMHPQVESSSQLKHPLLNMVYVWTFLKWPPILQAGGHAHGRYQYQVWRKKVFKIIIYIVNFFKSI